MVMSDDPKLTNYVKRYKDHIFYGSDDSDGGYFLGLKASLLTQKKKGVAESNGIWE